MNSATSDFQNLASCMKNTHLEILLVEDNDGDIFLIAEALQEIAFRTHLTICKDGYNAILFLDDVLQGKSDIIPAIILLDINLPKKNGHEVLQFLKGNDRLKQIPVIMLTTSSSQFDINLAYKHNANAFICKPVDLEEFTKVVKSLESFWFNLARLPVFES